MTNPIPKTLRKTAATQPSKPSFKPLIILPAFNEQTNIKKVLEGIQQEAPGFPVLVVNDGSTDNTAQIAQDMGAKIISLPFNCGYGVALQTGFRFAVKNNYNLVIQMDADGQHDTRSIKFLIKEVLKSNVDVVIGSRFLGPGSYKPSLARRIGMGVFGLMASFIIRQKITDPTSGFQALKGGAIRFVASDLYPPDYPDADFIILLQKSGYKIREIPVRMYPPTSKSMHGGSKSLYYVFKMFLSICVTLVRQKPSRI